MKTLEDYILPIQDELFDMLCEDYKGNCYVNKDSYILVKGKAPILLVAHMDTVHKERVQHICKSKGGKILMSPQGIGGDDRCGIYALNAVYARAEVKPWLLFTCDEEIGGYGAKDFAKDYHMADLPKELDFLKCIVEIDRKGKNDAVYYDCGNEEFEDYITSKGFVTNWGSFSDISLIAPELGVAAVNLSSGYYNAHTLYEYIDRQELNNTIGKVLSIVNDSVNKDFPVYEYIESKYSYDYDDWSYYGLNGWYTYKSDKDEVDSALKGIPDSIRDEYDALLDYHSKTELDHIRREMGDDWILKLFETEFGGTFDEVFGDYDEESEEV